MTYLPDQITKWGENIEETIDANKNNGRRIVLENGNNNGVDSVLEDISNDNNNNKDRFRGDNNSVIIILNILIY